MCVAAWNAADARACISKQISGKADNHGRAGAWATIIAIQDASVPAMEWRDEVKVEHKAGPSAVCADFRVRADPDRSLLVEGQYWTYGDGGGPPVQD